MVFAPQVAQRTEAWQQLRSGRITASAFAAVIGYQFGKTGQDGLKNLQGVWREKMGVQRPEPDWYGRNAMEYGTRYGQYEGRMSGRLRPPDWPEADSTCFQLSLYRTYSYGS